MKKEIFIEKCKKAKKWEYKYVAFWVRSDLWFYSVEKIRFEWVENKNDKWEDLYTILIEKTWELMCCIGWHIFNDERGAILQSRILNREVLKNIQKDQEKLWYLF